MRATSHVPDGWRLARLGELASIRNEQVMPAPGDARPYVALEHIVSGGSLNGYGRASDSVSNKTVFHDGDTLYGKLRPNLRKVVRAEFDGICSTDILAVFSRSGADAGFLSHLLRSDAVYRHAMQGVAGTKMPRTSWKHLSGFRLSVPPIREQRAIAAILDSIDEAIERTQEVFAATERLRDALLHDLLTRGLPGRHTEFKQVRGLGSVPASWEVVRLGDCLDSIEAGRSAQCESRPAGPLEWGVLKVSSVSWGTFKPEENKAIRRVADVNPRFEVQVGDVIISRANTPDLVGAAVIVRSSKPRVLLSDKTLRLVPDPSLMEREFLAHLLRHPALRRLLTGAATGSSRSMYNVSQESIRNLQIALPPQNEQESISSALEVVDAQLQMVRCEVRAYKVLKDSVTDALLTGRLETPQSIADTR